MTLSGSLKTAKYLLFGFNILFFITGIILLSVGVSVKAYYAGYETILDDQYFLLPNLLFAIGVIIFLISFFGCCGAIKDSYCMMVTFSTLLMLVFVLQLAAGIAGYALTNQTIQFLTQELTHSMSSYNQINGTQITVFWDNVQVEFQCCGVYNASDWAYRFDTNETTMPISCCKPIPGSTNSASCTAESKNVFSQGCLDAFGSYIKSHTLTLGDVGIGFAIVPLLGIMFSYHLLSQFKKNYEDI